MVLPPFVHDECFFFACAKICTYYAYTLMCMSCMVHNLHDLCLNMYLFLCDLHELYHVDALLCLYILISHSMVACLEVSSRWNVFSLISSYAITYILI